MYFCIEDNLYSTFFINKKNMQQVEQLPKRKSLSRSQVQASKAKQDNEASIHTDWDLQCEKEQLKSANQPKMEDVLLNNKQGNKSKNQNNSFMKIKDINQYTKQYSVVVKVLKSIEEKSYHNGMNRVKVTLADQTASAHGFFKGENCQYFKVGNVVAIKKGLVRIFKGHIQLQLSDFGRIIELNAKLNENTDINISNTQIKENRHYRKYNRFNQRRTQYSSKRSSQYKSYNYRSKRYQYQGQRQSRYADRQQGQFYQKQHQQKRYNEPYRTQQKKYYQQQEPLPKYQQKHPSKQSISFLLRKRSFSREKSLSSLHNMDKKNKYYKLRDVRGIRQKISVVGRIKRISYRQNYQYLMIILQDETGTIKAYLPNNREIYEGNIVVAHNLKCKLDRSNQYVLVVCEDTVVSKARQNLQPFFNIYK